MPTITHEQIAKFEKSCKNGFKFDFNYYLMHSGDKTLFKYIEIENNKFLKVELMFTSDYKNFREIKNIPTLWLSVCRRDGNFMVSHGLGQKIHIGESQKTKKFSLLQELTEKFTDKYILNLHNEKTTSKKEII